MLKKISFMLKNESGATAVEYALLLAMITIVLVAAIVATGTSAETTFGASADAIKSVLK